MIRPTSFKSFIGFEFKFEEVHIKQKNNKINSLDDKFQI